MQIIFFLLLMTLSSNSFADNKQYLSEFDQYLVYVNILQQSKNDKITVDASLVSETFINKLQIKARIYKKSINIINREEDKLLANK